MANSSWNEIDIYSKPVDQYICAFIDILGYKNKSAQFFSGNFNLFGRFDRATTTCLKLNKLIGFFVDLSHTKIKFFSDSIIITTPINKENPDGLFNVLQICRVLSAHLSFENLFIRGGVAKGVHVDIEMSNYSFMSSLALQRAYEIESTLAIYPRILIDESLISEIPTQLIASHVIKSDDCFMLHFAPEIINCNGNNINDIVCEMNDIESEMEKAPGMHAKEKYEWLLDYYYWTLSQIDGVNLNKFAKFKSNKNRSFSRVV